MLKENLNRVLDKIQRSCSSAQRKPQEVKLLFVTKYLPVNIIEEALILGQELFGENYVQEAEAKRDYFLESSKLKIKDIGSNLKPVFHLIGPLQKNKAKKAITIFDLIHSVDSFELAKSISKEAQKIEKIQDILIQINVSEEFSKAGIHPSQLLESVEKIALLPNIKIVGVMSMGTMLENETLRDKVRKEFQLCYELVEKLSVQLSSSNLEISMGTSLDYDIAIAEGATIVRVGSAIYERGK